MTLNDTSSLLAFLKSRKSASVKAMGGQGPTPQQQNEILEIATRVPDHGFDRGRFAAFQKGQK